MDIQTIYEMWDKDGALDQTNISAEAVNIPKLHNKYFRMYSEHGLKLRKMRADLKTLTKLKTDWYKGEMSAEDLKAHGWSPQPLKILRTDIPTYIDSDSDIIRKTLLIGVQEEIVAYLESIVKQINNRNFLLKTVIDWEKFRTGA